MSCQLLLIIIFILLFYLTNHFSPSSLRKIKYFCSFIFPNRKNGNLTENINEEFTPKNKMKDKNNEKVNKKNNWPTTLYVEGQDQFRGWFNSSLITSVILTGEAPYQQVLSHGF